MGDFIVISVLVIIIGLIVFSSVRNRKKGGHCAGCSKCSENCKYGVCPNSVENNTSSSL
ncbi:MAG: FeoB-associated Cys-rich membrane protein [Clostridia bacterium]|nr:FeoB-associated Cys-rich membrane protein [Clostridia bacterium]